MGAVTVTVLRKVVKLVYSGSYYSYIAFANSKFSHGPYVSVQTVSSEVGSSPDLSQTQRCLRVTNSKTPRTSRSGNEEDSSTACQRQANEGRGMQQQVAAARALLESQTMRL